MSTGTVRTLVGCRSVRLPTSPGYARNVPIMLESVPIMLALCSIFPRPYYARHYAGTIRPSLFEGIFFNVFITRAPTRDIAAQASANIGGWHWHVSVVTGCFAHELRNNASSLNQES